MKTNLNLNRFLLVALPWLIAACGGATDSGGGAVTVATGGDSSGGADLHGLADGAAWFVGRDKTIQVCFETSADFKVPGMPLSDHIQNAFAKWKKYAEAKYTYLDPQYGLPGLSFRPVITQAAPGGCYAHTPDLTIYFGVENLQVAATRGNNRKSFAFASRTSYDEATYWGKGFIWLRPGQEDIWRDDDAVQGILMHELGHVYGCEHVAETIMDADIANVVLQTTYARERHDRLTHIDHMKELTIKDHSEYVMTDYFGSLWEDKGPSRFKEYFEKILGRPAVLDLKARFVETRGQYEVQRSLIIGDAKGEMSIALGPMSCDYYPATPKVFYTALREKQGDVEYPLPGPLSYVRGGDMVTCTQEFDAGGRKWSLKMSWNLGFGGGVAYADGKRFSTLEMYLGPKGEFGTTATAQFTQKDWM